MTGVRRPVPAITPGMTLAVAEADYCYGPGMLLLIVERVDVDHDLLQSLDWVVVRGQELRLDTGAAVGPREVTVRAAALAAAIRPTGWLG